MRTIYCLLFISTLNFQLYSQSLAIYEFTGTGACPNPYTNVTAQPLNAVFSNYNSSGVNCSSTNDVYNNSGWNTSATINLDEYNEFSIIADSCYDFSLSNLTFSHRISNVTSVPTWYIRSSVDGFSTDLGSGTSSTTVYSTSISLPISHSHLNSVTFRFYLTSAAASSTTWRNDNVSVTGTVDPVTPQIYFSDNDGDGFGDPDNSQSACNLPLGYTTDSTDCNDADSLIHPNTIWYEDIDQDGFGNEAVTFIGCVPPLHYVLTNSDCDDQNASVTFASQTFYADNDSDGYGDLSVSEVACTCPPGYVTNHLDCDDNQVSVTIASTMYFEDSDSDGYGNSDVFQIACSLPVGYVLDSTDCNDGYPQIHPLATDYPNNGIDENCDGVDGYLYVTENEFAPLSVYPNPSDGHFTIEVSLGKKIILYDLKGQVLFENVYTKQVDFSDYPDGIYLLKIETEIDTRYEMVCFQ